MKDLPREILQKSLVSLNAERLPSRVVVVHDACEHLHLHLVLRNESVSGGALGWAKATIRLMHSMDWVSSETKQEFGIESGRGAGRNSPEFSDAPYPLAASLAAKQLAEMEMDKIHEIIRTGTIQVGHINKRGEITSIIYNGRRIRLRTIRGLAASGRVVLPEGKDGDSWRTSRRHQNLVRHRTHIATNIA
jgi:hypothetical protein